jgi:hypothetical protein
MSNLESNWNTGDFLKSTAIGAGTGAVMGGISGGVGYGIRKGIESFEQNLGETLKPENLQNMEYPGPEGTQYASSGYGDMQGTEVQITGEHSYSGLGRVKMSNEPGDVFKFRYNIKSNTYAKIGFDKQGIGAWVNKPIEISSRNIRMPLASIKGAYWNPTAQNVRVYYNLFKLFPRVFDYAY